MNITLKTSALLVLILASFASAQTALDFTGWDHGAITTGGQTFDDVCGEGIDVTVTASGTFASDSNFAITTAGGEAAIRSEHNGTGLQTFTFDFSSPIDLEFGLDIVDMNELFTITTDGTESYMHMSGAFPGVTNPFSTPTGSGIEIAGTSFGLDPVTGAASGIIKADGVTTLTVTYESFNETASQFGEFTLAKTAVVPEPGSLPLLGMGILGLLNTGRRRRRRS